MNTTTRERRDADVVVVGAGRMGFDTIDGARLGIGGQRVSPDKTALIDPIDELGLETFLLPPR